MNEELLKIDTIRGYLEKKKVDWTKHCLNRLSQRNISIADVKNAIKNGRIIEYYKNDYPYPSCLILGISINSRLLHIVCGMSHNLLHMITAYYPDSNEWEEDMKTRRKKE